MSFAYAKFNFKETKKRNRMNIFFLYYRKLNRAKKGYKRSYSINTPATCHFTNFAVSVHL